MEIKTEWGEGILVVMPEQRIDGSNATKFHDTLSLAIKDTEGSLVLDMERLTYVSSAGLRVILIASKTLESRDMRLLVCSLSEKVRRIFQISGIDKMVETHNGREDAIASLSG